MHGRKYMLLQLITEGKRGFYHKLMVKGDLVVRRYGNHCTEEDYAPPKDTARQCEEMNMWLQTRLIG